VFLFVVFMFSANKITYQRRPEADVSHYVSVPSGFTWILLTAYSEAKLKSSGDGVVMFHNILNKKHANVYL
jgi:hypothetical protein